MVSDTLSEGLAAYRIGPKIRALRTAKGLGLSQLGEHSGLSAGMLSKIERGLIFPTLPTLLRVALVFGVGLEHFFADGDGPVLEVVRRGDRLRLPDKAQGRASFYFESLDFPVPDRPLESYLAEFPPGAPGSEAHLHPGVELIYVIEGQLEVELHGRCHGLGPGDAMYFDSGFEHVYRAVGEVAARVVVVVSSAPARARPAAKAAG